MRSPRFLLSCVPCLSAMLMFLSCADRGVATIPLEQTSQGRVTFRVDDNRDIDILFVVDNSRSMKREQDSLAARFGSLIDALGNHPDGLPSVHLAVISTDVGAGSACIGSGDEGEFQGSQCPGLQGDFLSSIANEDGTRSNNFDGEIADVFACMSVLGIKGCGFEQPLESMRRALSRPEAESFIRPHAYLAVVFVTDEDDCSADPRMFDQGGDLNSPLGPLHSFRCFEFGVECDGPSRSEGVRENCRARTDSPYLYDIQEYVDFLIELKDTPQLISVATIAGALDPVSVVKSYSDRLEMDVLDLEFSCNKQDAEAVPPLRLNAFLERFESNQRASICDADLSDALAEIGRGFDEAISPCLVGVVADTDPASEGIQADCLLTVETETNDEQRLPLCDNEGDPNASTELPCFTMLVDRAICPLGKSVSGISPKVYYPEGFTVIPGTTASLRCSLGG